MINELLPLEIADEISESDVTEIRLRIGRKLSVSGMRYRSRLMDYICGEEDIKRILRIASNHSLYTISEQLTKGFLVYKGGVRIGICGEGVIEGGRITAMKNINSLCIRVPHEIKGIAEKLPIDFDRFENTIIASPPGCGKTTYLRDIARLLSNKGNNVIIIDERNEISGIESGFPHLDVGNCDVITGLNKNLAFEKMIRSMAPDIIITDELFSCEDIANVVKASHAGIKIATSVHADRFSDITDESLTSIMKNFILLSDCPTPGTVRKILKKGGAYA